MNTNMKRAALAVILVTTAFGHVQAAAPAGRYLVTADVVTDTHTGLLWERQALNITRSFSGAATYCQGLSLPPGSGWRVPSFKELQTIVDETVYNPAIDLAAFPGSGPHGFWSSTPVAAVTPNLGWLVSFDSGYANYDGFSSGYRVRCVR